MKGFAGKKYFSLFLTVFILIISSCPVPYNVLSKDEIFNDIELPHLSGTFSLSVNTSRTVFPQTPLLTDFVSFELNFTHNISGALPPMYPTVTGSAFEPVILAEGTYSLVINAYKDTARTVLGARGEASGIIISAGQNTSRNVPLRALFSEGAGNFSWNIQFPADVIEADMIIADFAGNTVGVKENLITNGIGARSNLPSGAYTASFYFRTSGGRELVWKEAVHIYAALNSDCFIIFEDKHFSLTSYIVIFYENDADGGTVQQSYIHGSQIDITDFVFIWNDHFLVGWYTDNGTFLNEWDFDREVIGNMTLYAKWLPDKFFGVDFTPLNDKGPVLKLGAGANIDIVSNIITIYRPGISGTHEASAVVTAVNSGEYTNIEWNISSMESGSLANGVNTITLSSSDNRYNMYGDKILTVTGSKIESGTAVRYTTNVLLRVMPVFTVTFNPDNGQPQYTQVVPAGGKINTSLIPSGLTKTFAPQAGLYLNISAVANPMPAAGWRRAGDLTDFDFAETAVTGNFKLTAHYNDGKINSVAPNNLAQAVTYVNNNASSANNYTMYINSNIRSAAQTLNTANARLSIEGMGEERVIQATASNLLTVSTVSTARLTLGNNITLRGSGSGTSTILTVSSGNAEMNSGSRITGHTTSSVNGAVNINGGTFTMNGNAEISGNRTTAVVNNAAGGVSLNNGTFIFNSGKVSGNFRNTDIPSDIINSSTTTTALRLYSEAEIGVLTLYGSDTSATSRSVAAIYNAQKISDTVLHIYGDGTNMNAAVQNIEGKQFITGNSYTLTQQDIDSFIPGNLMSSNDSMPITNLHYINFTSGSPSITGRLLSRNAQTPVITTQPVNSISYIVGGELNSPIRVAASVYDGGEITYQWYRHTLNRSSGGVPVPAGSGGNLANLPPDLTELGTFYYYCIITNTNPNALEKKVSDIASVVTSVRIADPSSTTVYVDYTDSESNNVTEQFIDLETAFMLMPVNSGNYTVRIKENQTLPPRTITGSGRNITIKRHESVNTRIEIQLRLSDTGTGGSLFTINTGVIVTLETGLTLRGIAGNSGALVSIAANGTFNMNDGTLITNNINTYTGTLIAQFGGGVRNAGTFNMSGGEISGNRVQAASNNGAGIYVPATGITNIGGSADITGNVKGTAANNLSNNVFLVSGRTITLGTGSSVPTPSAGMLIGVTSAVHQTNQNDIVQIAANADTGTAAYFVSDSPNYSIVYESGSLSLTVMQGLRFIVFEMRDSYGDGWDGNGSLRISVNGNDAAYPKCTGSGSSAKLGVLPGDLVEVYWISGTNQGENAFVIYYEDTPLSTAFNPAASGNWTDINALLIRLYGGLSSAANGQLLGSFVVP